MRGNMKLNMKNIILGIIGIAVLYFVLKVLLFIIETVFKGVVAVFTNGIIYLVIIAILIYVFRKPIIQFFKSINGESTYFRKEKKDVIYVSPSKEVHPINNNADRMDVKPPFKMEKVVNQKMDIVQENQKGKNEGTLKSDFITFVKALSTKEISHFLDTTYKEFSKKFQNEAGFGDNGAREFAA
jgi:glucan phosphoethanolaminetransferase (alkaline phosphatase superfamily)